MTTSFAHFVRGNWSASAHANPAGLLLALLCLIQIPWTFTSAALGRWWLTPSPQKTALVLGVVVLAVCLVQWLVRLV